MPVLTVNVLLQDVKRLKTDALIVGFFEDRRPLAGLAGELDWLLCGALSHLVINHKLCGSPGEVALITSQGKVPATKIFLVGMGHFDGITASAVRNAVEAAVSAACNAGVRDMALECFSVPSLSWDAVMSAQVQGAADAVRRSQAKVHLLAPDAARYEQLSKILNGPVQAQGTPVPSNHSVDNTMTVPNTDIRRE